MNPGQAGMGAPFSHENLLRASLQRDQQALNQQGVYYQGSGVAPLLPDPLLGGRHAGGLNYAILSAAVRQGDTPAAAVPIHVDMNVEAI